MPEQRRMPVGSDRIAHWSATRGLAFEAQPQEPWFRRWEPYDTMAPPAAYLNACTWRIPQGVVVLVEPWTASDEMEPLERTILGFATHPGLMRRAAMRVGEHFLTRTLFLESPPPPKVTVGDRVWDEHAATFAASSLEAATAFHPALRRLLAGWGFQGHLELRAGGLVVHYAGLQPTPENYERLLRIVLELGSTAAAPTSTR